MSLGLHVLGSIFFATIAFILQGCGQQKKPDKFMRWNVTGSIVSPSPANPNVQANCSHQGANCKTTGCCYLPNQKCYVKDEYFAGCRANCTPGVFLEDPKAFRTPWSCEEYRPPAKEQKKLESPAPTADLGKCAGQFVSCLTKPCCGGLSCFEKNRFWAECKERCTPGVDTTDPPDLQTPWSCRLREPNNIESEVEVVPENPTLASAPVPAPVASRTSPTQQSSTPLWVDSLCTNESGEQGLLPVAGLTGKTFAQGGGGHVSGDTLTLSHNSGYSLMRTCRHKLAPDEFVQLRLLGKTLSFTVDLSRVGCACNLAFYLVAAPALDPAGVPSKGDCTESEYYCDANRVCGQWCTEVDIMEANNHVFQATPHKCDQPTSTGHFNSCDRSGCEQNTKTMPNSYGPGPSFTINTMRPFTVSTVFMNQGSTFTGMVTKLDQEGRQVVLSHTNCDPGYLAQISASMDLGMSLRMTYWGDKGATMGWMDYPQCPKYVDCAGSNAGDGVIRGITVDPPQWGPPTRNIPGVQPQPPPLPHKPATTPRPPVVVPAPPEQPRRRTHLWSVLLLLVGCLGLYVSAVALLWRFPGLGPRLEKEPVCEWMSLLAAQGDYNGQANTQSVSPRTEIPVSARETRSSELSRPPSVAIERPGQSSRVFTAIAEVNQMLHILAVRCAQQCVACRPGHAMHAETVQPH